MTSSRTAVIVWVFVAAMCTVAPPSGEAGSADSVPHAQVTYILPLWLNFLGATDAQFQDQVQQLRLRIGEGPFVRVGLSVYVTRWATGLST